MKTFFSVVVLVLLWAVSSPAAVVYLKDGGQIKAKRVWRENGKVVVLVNHEAITSFANSEVNLKKTFPPRKKRVRLQKATQYPSAAPGVPATGPTAVQASEQSAKGGKKITLPSLPNKLPERQIPAASEEGTLRKQKREMDERLKE